MQPSRIRLVLALLSLSLFVHAQVGQILDKTKLPTCAFGCALLSQAQSLCVPPIAPTADPGVYQACFCNSNYLAPFRTGVSAGVCDAECTAPTDLAQMQTWFTGLCQGGAVVIPNNGVVTGTTTATTATAATGTPATDGSSSSGDRTERKSWIDQHYRWIIMVIVLFIAALSGIFIGLYFKRRYDRRHALAGHNRGHMLAADEAAQSLRDRHPSNMPMKGQDSVSQVQLPPMMQSRESLPSRGMTASSMGMHSDRTNGEFDRSVRGRVTNQPSSESLIRSGSRLQKGLQRDER